MASLLFETQKNQPSKKNTKMEKWIKNSEIFIKKELKYLRSCWENPKGTTL